MRMTKVHKLPAKHRQKTLIARWTEIMAGYRRRHRIWVMKSLPTMPDDEWRAYERWVAEFGATTLNQTGRHGRKVRRQLRAARVEGPKLRAEADAAWPQRNMYSMLAKWWTEIDDKVTRATALPPTVTMRVRK